MIICQVDAWFSAMGKEDVERELKVVEEVLAAIDGQLLGAEVRTAQGRILAYVRAESELVVGDVFEASYFNVERIARLGWRQEARIPFEHPANQDAWRYPPPAEPSHSPAGQNRRASAL